MLENSGMFCDPQSPMNYQVGSRGEISLGGFCSGRWMSGSYHLPEPMRSGRCGHSEPRWVFSAVTTHPHSTKCVCNLLVRVRYVYNCCRPGSQHASDNDRFQMFIATQESQNRAQVVRLNMVLLSEPPAGSACGLHITPLKRRWSLNWKIYAP